MTDPIQEKMQNIFEATCGSWQNCNEANALNFLSQCEEQGIDPQYCLSWLEQNKEYISEWSNLAHSAQEWVTQHTSTGSPVSFNNQTES